MYNGRYIGLFSMAFSGLGAVVYDWSAISNNGFFHGYSWLVVLVILLQVCKMELLSHMVHLP